jgi:hypothetical protein
MSQAAADIRSRRLPVLAAGGLVDGNLATALSLGAQVAVFGAAPIATPESFGHDDHERRLIDAFNGDIVLNDALHIDRRRGAKERVLANSVTRRKRGVPCGGERIVVDDETGQRRPVWLTKWMIITRALRHVTARLAFLDRDQRWVPRKLKAPAADDP